MQHGKSARALVARDHVAHRVVADVAHVDACRTDRGTSPARSIWACRRWAVGDPEAAARVPGLLPARLGGVEIIGRGGGRGPGFGRGLGHAVCIGRGPAGRKMEHLFSPSPCGRGVGGGVPTARMVRAVGTLPPPPARGGGDGARAPPLAPAPGPVHMPDAFRVRVMGAGRFGPPCAERSLLLVRPNVARAGGPSGAPPGIRPAVALELTFIVSSTTFAGLGLAGSLLNALDRQGFHTPTPIQAGPSPRCWTAATCWASPRPAPARPPPSRLPILQHLVARPSRPQPRRHPRRWSSRPTRELALQIGESFAHLRPDLRLRRTVIFGGVGQSPRCSALRPRRRHPGRPRPGACST